MSRIARSTTALVGLALFAACAKPSSTASTDSALQRDLDRAGATGVDLASGGGARTDVVSAVERTGGGTAVRARTPVRAAAKPSSTQATVAAIPATPSPQEPAAQVVVVPNDTAPAPIAAPRPRPAQQTPGRRGPYKSVGDVIRNAPFPINP